MNHGPAVDGSESARPEEGRFKTQAFVIAAVVGVFLVGLLFRGAFPTPFSDEFYFYEIYLKARQGDFDLQTMVQPHFGHVYVLLKSWFWAVVHYQLDWRVSMYAQAAFMVLTMAMVAHYSLVKTSSKIRLLLAVSAALALGSARQWENLYWALQISAASMFFFTIAAFYWVDRYAESQDGMQAILASICGLMALLSNGGGLASFVITMAALVVVCRKNSLRLIFAVIEIVFVALVFMYMLPSGGGAVGASLMSPGNFITYVLAFFANALFSFSERGDDVYSLCLGAAVLGCTAYTIKISWNSRYEKVFAYLLIGFSLASCLMIAYARLKGGHWQPNASRYYTFALPLLLGNLLILGSSRSRVDLRLSLGLAGLIIASFAQSYLVEWKTSPHRFAYSKEAHSNLCRGSSSGLAFHDGLETTNIQVLQDVFCSAAEKN